MHSRSRPWAALLVALVVSPALADAPGWVLYTHPDKLMSLRFPGKPKESEQTREVPHGTLRVKLATFTDGTRGFTSTVEVYPSGTKLKVSETYNGIFENLLSVLEAHVVSQKAVTVDGFSCRDVEIAGPGSANEPLRGTGRMCASNDPVSTYLALAIQMDGKPDPDARKFLESLHLGKQVETRR
jgi:hypothetical protein